MAKKIFSREEQKAFNKKRAKELYTDPERREKYCEYALLAYDNDVIYFRIDRVAQDFVEDYFDFDAGISKEDKEWAYSVGQLGCKMYSLGINRDNYQNYISDFAFYNKSNYMNEKFDKWFDHKLSTYYVMAPFIDNMPEHYYYILNNQIMPLNDFSDKNATVEDILNLIVQKNKLVAKACVGGHGVGFYKFEYKDGSFYQNAKKISKDELIALINSLDDYLITEYINAAKAFRDACNDTFTVIRVVMVFDPEDGPQLTGAFIRLGTDKAGIVCDYPGTINCGVDLKTGKLFKPLYRGEYYKLDPIVFHPDSHVKLDELFVETWPSLVEGCKMVSRHLAMTPYLVMDIIPTDDGFKILEINSHGQVKSVEAYYPFLLNEYNRKVFNIE
ncbi:MAG: hypothetical protein IJG23_00325 [Clostridia bacterium]|nr:hypothetical protein [Clostridia bacterium]